MDWIHDYQLFLFDFDGLLVNTEEIHFLAYKKMCAQHGHELDWDFDRYCQAAHYDPQALRVQIYDLFPALKAKIPEWKILYEQKKQNVFRLVNEGAIQLMPGVHELLKHLQTASIKHCVVTHSPIELVQAVCKQHEVLRMIPFWITREDYSHPKPHSECYLKAIEKYAQIGDNVIGFEDSPRGLRSLLGTKAKSVLISQVHYPEIPEFVNLGALHYPTFDAISTA